MVFSLLACRSVAQEQRVRWRRSCSLLSPYRPRLCLLLLVLLLSRVSSTIHFASATSSSPPQYNLWYFALHVTGIVVDEQSGEVYMSDANRNRIIRASSRGEVLGTLDLPSPSQLALHNGSLYVASGSDQIITVGRNAMTGGMQVVNVITALTGFTTSSCIAVSHVDGSLYVADGWGGRVTKLASDGWPAMWSIAVNTSYIAAITLDDSDTLYIADSSQTDDRILRVLSNGIVLPLLPVSLSLTSIRSIHWSPYPSTASPRGALYVLVQPPSPVVKRHLANPPTRVLRVSVSTGEIEGEWHGVDSSSICTDSFNSWPAALYVEGGTGNVYFSDAIQATQGCLTCCDGAVRGMAPDGQTLQSYTMTDEPWTSIHALSYDSTTCTVWYAYQVSAYGSSLVRMAPDGRSALQIFPTPTISAPGRGAMIQHITLIIPDHSTQPHTLLLVTQGDAFSTTRMYRFDPVTGFFTFLDYEAAIRRGSTLDPFWITGLAVDELGSMYVSSKSDGRVVKLDADGSSIPSFSTIAEVVHPSHLAIAPSAPPSSNSSAAFSYSASVLFAVDEGPPQVNGRLLSLNASTGGVIKVYNSVLPNLYFPQTLLFDLSSATIFVADLNGNLFHLSPYTDELLHMYYTVPPAYAISSLTVDRFGSLYAWDEYSFRVIVLLLNTTTEGGVVGWPASNTSCAALPTDTTQTEADSKAIVIVIVAVVGVVLLAAAATVWVWKRRRATLLNRLAELSSLSSPLLDGDEEAGINRNGAASLHIRHSYAYYVSLYEVGSALRDEEALRQREQMAREWALDEDLAAARTTPSPPSPTDSPTAIVSPVARPQASRPFQSHLPHTRPATDSPRSRSPFPPHSSRALSSPGSPLSSPPEGPLSPSTPGPVILRSSLKDVTVLPTFVDEVEDLTPLGEGSAGRVYRGFHRGMAVVVKLPKSTEITGAQWREWQAHLRLPPHPHLVAFVGALVMEHNNHLVTKLVQQGSLKGLLGDGGSGSASIYSRPYAVLRAAHELCQALCHIHRHKLVHRDVSARNVLVDGDGSFVLADLGLCQEMSGAPTGHSIAASFSTAASDSSNVAIPVRWTAPESLLTGEFTSKSDVWSLGVTLWEMSNRGALPYGEERQTPREQQRMISGIVRGEVRLKAQQQWTREGGERDRQDEMPLMEKATRLIALSLTRDAEQRPDSELLLRSIEDELEEWEKDAGEAVQRVKRKWADYHRTILSS